MDTELTPRIVAFTIDELYVLVEWPFVQDLMGYEWFRQECYLHNAFSDQQYLDSAYFVPLARMLEVHDNTILDNDFRKKHGELFRNCLITISYI